MDAESISVGFSSGRGPVPWLIRRLTSSRVSHTFFLFRDPVFDADMVLEAVATGFHLVPYERWKVGHAIVAEVPIHKDLRRGMRHIASLIGTHYDYAGLFGALVVLAGRWLKHKWHNPFRSRRSMFCSEAIVRVLAASSYPGASALDPEDTTPQDLLDFLQAGNSGA